MIVAGIMAAGLSQRFGGMKQLCNYKDKPLAQHAIDSIHQLDICYYTILGYQCDLMTKHLSSKNWLINPNFQEGLGSSISFFVNHVIHNHPQATKVLIHLADLPDVTSTELESLIASSGKQPVACRIGSSIGPPCIFPNSYFDRLAQLSGAGGAKFLLKEALVLDIPSASKDIDYQKDLIQGNQP